MSHATLTQPGDSDQNLLFGVLALQADLIDESQFVEACTICAGRKSVLLADFLLERGWISERDRRDVERLMERKLKRHNNDLKASLAAACDAARHSLAAVNGKANPAESQAPDAAAPVEETGPYVAPRRDRYRLNRIHASGGIGRVWLAYDGELHREVALKELRPDRREGADYATRFIREARITGQLEHPGIVPVYELNPRASTGQPFYVMRFIKGRTLSQAIDHYHCRASGEAHAVEFRSLLNTFVELCNAVAYAHSRGVIHRDIKGSNVVLGDFGEVIVLDWGLAKLVGREHDEEAPITLGPDTPASDTQAGAVIGTPAYMAPEQAQGRADLVGPRSDIYSLGAVLYEILTGQPPYTGKDKTEILRRVREEDPQRPGTLRPVAPALEAVCLTALARQPERRYASARELAAEIENWLADEPVRVWREPVSVRAGRWARRHKPILTAAAALLVTAVVALAVSTALVLHEKGKTESALVDANNNYEEMKRQRTRAETNATTAQEQRAAAVHARRRAESNLRQACEAVDLMLTRVSEDPDLLAYEPRMEQVRSRLLQDALAFYQQFLEEHGDDQEVRAETVRAARRTANILQELGRHTEAAAHYDQAIALCGQLRSEFSTAAAYQQELAGIHNSLGILYRATGKVEEAEAEYGKAVALKRQLINAHPDVAVFRAELANSLHNQCALLRELGRTESALNVNGEALRLRRELVEVFPQEPTYRHNLGKDLNLLALLLDDQGNPIDEEAICREALEQLQKLAHEYPHVPQYRQTLALTHMNLGILLRKLGRADEGEKELRESLSERTKLADSFPGIPAYRSEQARTCSSLALALIELKRTDEAKTVAEKGVALQRQLVNDYRHVPAFRNEQALGRLHYGYVLYSCGEQRQAEVVWKEALDGGEKLVGEHPLVPDYHLHLAGLYGELAVIHLRHKELPRARRCVEQAITSSHAALKLNPGHYTNRDLLRRLWQLLLRVVQESHDHKALAATSEEWYRTDADGPRDLYVAGRYLSRCAYLADGDESLAADQRKEAAGRYGARAVEMLQAAVRQGFTDGKQLKNDPYLDLLRNREDFKALQAMLDKGR